MTNSLKLLVKSVQINALEGKKIYSAFASGAYHKCFFTGNYKSENGKKLPSSALSSYKQGVTGNLIYEGDLFKPNHSEGKVFFERHTNLTQLLEICLRESNEETEFSSYLFKLRFLEGKRIPEEDLMPGWDRSVQAVNGIAEFKIPFESYPFTLRMEDRAWNDIGQKFKLLDICENNVPLFHLGEILLEK